MDIEGIIDSERKIFENILKKKVVDQKKIEAFRRETVIERRLRIAFETYDFFDGLIQYGPLAGMRLSKETQWGKSDLGSMILGLYEKPILDFIFSKTCNSLEKFINIGAADGYYAVGLVFANKFKEAHCYEKNLNSHSVINNLAKINGVAKKISINSEANKEILMGITDKALDKTLFLIDIEGGEFNLLDFELLEKFSSSTIIIEIHDLVDRFLDKYSDLLQNASNFFDIKFLKRRVIDLCVFDKLDHITDDNRFLLCSEGRQNAMRFIALIPKNKVFN